MKELRERLVDVREGLRELRARDRDLRLFGAAKHRYAVHPATERTVARFEQRYHAPLPEPFRRLVLEVTDGGAGPGYGLHALDADRDVRENLDSLGEPFDHDFFLGPDPANLEFESAEARDLALERYGEHMPGTMTLCDTGCGFSHCLVVTGALAGQVLSDERAASGVRLLTLATDREHAEDHTPLDVIAWYQHWLDVSLARVSSTLFPRATLHHH